jgi:hypothetical protein
MQSKVFANPTSLAILSPLKTFICTIAMDLTVTHEERKVVRHLTIIIVTLGLFLSWPMVKTWFSPKDPIQVANQTGWALPAIEGTWGSDSSATLTFKSDGSCVGTNNAGSQVCKWQIFDITHPHPAFTFPYEEATNYLAIATKNNTSYSYYKILTLTAETLSLELVTNNSVTTFTKLP